MTTADLLGEYWTHSLNDFFNDFALVSVCLCFFKEGEMVIRVARVKNPYLHFAFSFDTRTGNRVWMIIAAAKWGREVALSLFHTRSPARCLKSNVTWQESNWLYLGSTEYREFGSFESVLGLGTDSFAIRYWSQSHLRMNDGREIEKK